MPLPAAVMTAKKLPHHGMPSELIENNKHDYVSTLLKYITIIFHLIKSRL